MAHKLIERTINQDKTIKLKFDGGSWATMTFQENNRDTDNHWWNVLIHSDWGNWSYGWSFSGMGKKSIYSFMLGMKNDDYLQNKFMGPHSEIFSPEKTATALRKEIREHYPWLKDKEKHEELMYKLKEAADSCDDNIDIFMRDVAETMTEVWGDSSDVYYNIASMLVYETHPRTAYFFKKIFPKFFPMIRKLDKEYV